MPAPSRRPAVPPAVDWLKTIAIVAVVVGHSGPFVFGPIPWLDRLVRQTLVAFHVSLFLMVSGYLHATGSPVSPATLWKRWRGILGPYLLASIVMLTFSVERVWPVASWPAVLAVGNALGMYYFVPIWMFCVLTGWVWSRLGPLGLAIALVTVVLATVVRILVSGPMDFIWLIRDPLLQGWLLSYLLGWCAARLRWVDWITAHRGSVLLAFAACAPWFLSEWFPPSPLRIAYAAGIAWIVIALATRPAPTPVQWVGRETLAIYLWHAPVVYWLTPPMAAWPVVPRLAVQTTATLGIVIAGIVVVRRLATHVDATRRFRLRPPSDTSSTFDADRSASPNAAFQ